MIIFCLLSLLLVSGKLLRIALPVLQKLYLPSSVIGGVLGLLLFSFAGNSLPETVRQGVGMLPGFLINAVFAALFLGVAVPRFREVSAIVIPQFCFGQMLAWGQYVVGLGITIVLLMPLFGVNPAFGNLLEIGFEGGHGTVGGMSEAFRSFNWQDGIALGYTVATAGMILGVVVGMILINWAFRAGYVSHIHHFGRRSARERRGLYARDEMPGAGRQTVFADSIDSLAWHVALIGIAILIGLGMLKGLQYAEIFCDLSPKRLFAGFPLFPLCMIGGLLLQKFALTIRQEYLIDHGQMQRLSGAALDFLVVSALTSIQIKVVAANWLPLLIITLAGLAWSIFAVLVLGRRLFRDAWFERSIAEFGQSMGVTATGLLLLRTVDPENRTVASAAFGYKQLLHEPLMGGGLWTALALTLVFTIGIRPVFLICAGVFCVWLIVFALLRRRSKLN